MKREKYYYIDLFSGAGGAALGLLNAGWKGFFAIEKNKDAFATLRYNLIEKNNHFSWPGWLPLKNHDINEIIKRYPKELESIKGTITLVAGGPPCQGFSTAGAREEKDERNSLVHSYIKFIEIIKPSLILFENVRGFMFNFISSCTQVKQNSYYQEVVTKLKSLGYQLDYHVINFADYGIPQNRNRFILVGKLGKEKVNFFKLLDSNKQVFLESKKLKSRVTLKEAISDLLEANGTVPCPDSSNFHSGTYGLALNNYQKLLRDGNGKSEEVPDSHRFTNHKQDTIKQFAAVLAKGEKNRRISNELKEELGIKKRSLTLLAAKEPCQVLTSHPDDYIHYCEPRILTPREYARIQSFPDWYEFKGKYTTGGKARKKEVPRYTQLGNAIPPLFAEQVGLVLKQLI
jgi:DNA (cytosine-5)-methyltransferase 1